MLLYAHGFLLLYRFFLLPCKVMMKDDRLRYIVSKALSAFKLIMVSIKGDDVKEFFL